jgi:hypothetical protein
MPINLTPSSPGTNGQMTLADARAIVRQFAKNAGDATAYSAAEIDVAIQAVCDDFIAHTLATRTSDTADVTVAVADVDVSGITGFRPDRLIRAWLEDDDGKEYPNLLSVADTETRDDRVADDTAGLPGKIAFPSTDAAVLYPTPDAAYTLHVDYRAPLTTFTAGTGSPETVTLNIDDDYLRTVMMYGATAFLQANHPEYGYASQSYQKYIAFRDSTGRRAGTRGARSLQRGV